ncbi:MAG: LysR family transcriptional regulator [Pseudomonadota bacterium]
MSRLPFKSMETVEAVVRLQSVTRAAEELGLSQSAVSNSVRRFEQDLGSPLFVRDAKGLTPTDAALAIAQATSDAKSMLQSALQIVEERPDTRDVKLSVPPTFAARWLAARLSDLRSAMKPVRLHISSRVDLSDTSDLWIRHGQRGDWPGLFSIPFLSETKGPVASPDLVGTASVSDMDVRTFPLIGVDARPQEWAAWAKEAGLDGSIEPQFTFDVTASTWDAAMAGSGVALGDLDFLRTEIENGTLRRLGATTLQSYRYFLCCRHEEKRREVLKVWDWFVAEADPSLLREQ